MFSCLHRRREGDNERLLDAQRRSSLSAVGRAGSISWGLRGTVAAISLNLCSETAEFLGSYLWIGLGEIFPHFPWKTPGVTAEIGYNEHLNAVLFIHLFAMFSYVFLCELPGHAWAVVSYSSSPTANTIFHTFLQNLANDWMNSAALTS